MHLRVCELFFKRCDEGYICTGGAETERPNGDGAVSDPQGGYVCAPGTYCPYSTDVNGDPDITEELDCDIGSYCANWGAGTRTDKCYAGYYCPNPGSSNPKQQICKCRIRSGSGLLI